MKIRIFLLTALLSAVVCGYGQEAIGTWKDYLNYSNTSDLDILEGKIYVATSNAIFVYNTQDNSVSRLNRINGLSDIGISTVRANPNLGLIIVGYINGNLDIIQNGLITNITDIKNSSVSGDKQIRHISFFENTAYISTGLGIIDFNLERLEVKDTYKILSSGDLSINETTVVNGILYAATAEGLFFGDLTFDLTIFSNWQQDLSVPDPFGEILNCASYNQKIYINQRGSSPAGLYMSENSQPWVLINESDEIENIRSNSQGISFTAGDYGELKGEDGINPAVSINSYSGNSANMASLIADESGLIWIADKKIGLVSRINKSQYEFIAPDGPATNRAFDIDVKHNQLWVASGAPQRPGTWNNNLVFDGFYAYRDGKWTNFIREVYQIINEETFADIAKVYVSPTNPNEAYIGSFFKGMMTTEGDEITNHFDFSNSSLQFWPDRTDTEWTGVAGFAQDNDRNIWISNSNAPSPLSVLESNGEWTSFDLLDGPDGIGNAKTLLDIIIDRQGQKWAIINKDGMVVFSEGADISDTSDDLTRHMKAFSGQGGLPSSEVLCLAEDLDGEIWVGTTDGIAVFYSPFDALTNNFSDSRQILVEQDGVFQYLLEGQSVSAVAIDGANRKWISTFGSGVFLMSEDGTEEIARFTTLNSPLLSDVVNDIAIDQNTGEVFFATNEGVVSYFSDATQGSGAGIDCNSVYPNPVRETYTGPISITGLDRDSEVKITDIRGNLIFTTISNGGKAIWDGKNTNGERVATGVYYALASNSDGSSKCTTKILVIK